MIRFNKPFIVGKELEYIKQAVELGKISGDGTFTFKCQEFFEKRYGFKKVLLTTSCTDALEMAALLSNIEPGDEVIMPSYTFVSTANAFVLRGANIKFCDVNKYTFNIDVQEIEQLISSKTKALVIVHYAGIACEMAKIMTLVQKHNLILVEDTALAIDSFYQDKPLGSFGHFATYSFHETKNIIAGEGGALVINDPAYIERAEIIREKGTNRSKFFRKETSKYEWIDIGSSFLPSEITAAYLFGQLEHIDQIQKKRISLWKKYFEELTELEQKNLIRLPITPGGTTINGQLFYIICKSESERTSLTKYLSDNNILAVFHYLPLHQSPFYKEKHDGRILPVTEEYYKRLLRLPLFYPMEPEQQNFIISCIRNFYLGNK